MILKLLSLIKLFFCNAYQSIIWMFFQIRTENFENYIKKSKRENSLAILATGPSLLVDIEKYRNRILKSDLCVVNDFCHSDIFYVLKPSMYVLADPMYFDSSIMGLTERKTMDILSKATWNIDLYVPYNCLKTLTKCMDNNYINVLPYHTNPYYGWKFVKFYLYKKGLSMPRMQNVLHACLFSGINMGYKRIDMYGVDHSWTKDIRVNIKNEVCLNNSHFYDTHSEQLVVWKKNSGEPYKMHEILTDLSFMFIGYHTLYEYSLMCNCVINNMTSDSFIDAFDRVLE